MQHTTVLHLECYDYAHNCCHVVDDDYYTYLSTHWPPPCIPCRERIDRVPPPGYTECVVGSYGWRSMRSYIIAADLSCFSSAACAAAKTCTTAKPTPP